MATHIHNVHIFNGDIVIGYRSVTIDEDRIVAIGNPAPQGAISVDGHGGTLLPGLIDSHVHTSVDALRAALSFGVTTELEMQGFWTSEQRAQIAADTASADVRSALLALMAKGGHPSELIETMNEDERPGGGEGWVMPSVSTPDEAVRHVNAMAAAGADYIKVMIEEGALMGHPGLPTIDTASLRSGVAEAHRLGLKVIAHAITYDATVQAIDIGVDGLAHLFIDRPADGDIVTAIRDAGIFVIPCLVISRSLLGANATDLAEDPRVKDQLSPEWAETLRGSFNAYPHGDRDLPRRNVQAMHAVGIEILAGTDASVPVPSHGGVAHGVSVHHELRLLVEAGLSPVEALRSATTIPSRLFGLEDRGRIAVGARADLVLVEGDPTTSIDDTLNIRDIWRSGHAVPRAR